MSSGGGLAHLEQARILVTVGVEFRICSCQGCQVRPSMAPLALPTHKCTQAPPPTCRGAAESGGSSPAPVAPSVEGGGRQGKFVSLCCSDLHFADIRRETTSAMSGVCVWSPILSMSLRSEVWLHSICAMSILYNPTMTSSLASPISDWMSV